jgi:hypothetical protein
MTSAHQNVATAIRKARDQARAILTELEAHGHAETGHSSGLYLALVAVQKRLLAVDPAPPPVARFIPELEQLVRECYGKLAPVKVFLDEALDTARRSPS